MSVFFHAAFDASRLEEPLVLTDPDDEGGENATAVVNPAGPWMVRFPLQPHSVEASLKRGIPEGVETDAPGAIDFLTKFAAGLEQAGFGVLLPSWWTAKGTKTRISASVKVRASKMQGSGLSLDELVKFDWEVALGDQTLSAQDLMALARLKTPLVRVRGQWVLLDAAEIKEAAARLKRRGEQATVRDLVRMALGGGDDRDIGGSPPRAGSTSCWAA
jgi:hypothetical protein